MTACLFGQRPRRQRRREYRRGAADLPEHLACHDRYLTGLTHLGGIGKAWSTFLDLNNVSDNDYFSDLGSLGPESRSRINLRRVAGCELQNLNIGITASRLRIIR